MKKFAVFSLMALLSAASGAYAQTPSNTPAAGDKTPTKTAKTAKMHKGHKKGAKTATTPAATPAQK